MRGQATGRCAIDEIYGEFDWELPANTRTGPTVVMITAARTIDETGNEAPSELIFGSILARRSRISTVLGIIVAISWLDVAGGMLSGTGLVKHHERSEIGSIIGSLSPPLGIDFEGAVQYISQRLLGSGTQLPYL